MAITVDYSGATFRLNVPQADLIFVSGNLYELDTDALFDTIKLLEAAEDGIVFQDMQSHNSEYTVAGETFAQKVEMLNATNSSNVDVFELFLDPDTQYSVKLTGSNNNLFDLENAILANAVTQVIPTNSAGLISNPKINDIWGHVRRSVFVDTSALTNGNGYQGSPFDNFTDAVDSAESSGITKLVLLADAVADRDLKNFTFEGIGSPTLDMNSKDFKGSHFVSCELDGTAVSTGPIRAEMCILRNGLTGIDGRFELCGYAGDIFLTPGSMTFLVDGYSTIGGAGRPSFDVGGGGCNVSLRGNRGGMTIKGLDNAGDEVSVGVAEGRLTLDASNSDGLFSLRGRGQFTDNSVGTAVDTTGFLDTVEIDEIYRDRGLDATMAKTITENVKDVSYDESTNGVVKEVRKAGKVTTITRQ